MANCINFDISVDGRFIEEEEKLYNEFKYYFPDIVEIYYGSFNLTAKWQHFADAMENISKKFSELFFEVFGDGGDNDDKFKVYIKNGCWQIEDAIITYREYDPDKMKPIEVVQ